MLKNNQKGFTLVELMVALAIGATILAAAVGIYVTTVINSGSVIASSRLNQELTTMMDVMVRDIRRAGYSGESSVVESPTSNSFQQVDVTALAIRASIASPTADVARGTDGTCILYAYDSDPVGDANEGVLNATDMFGFRLNNGVVQMRQQGDTADARHDSCAGANDTWIDVTDASTINISTLTFNAGASECITTREKDGLDNDGANGIDDDAEADCYDVVVPTAGSGEITVEAREIEITLIGNLIRDPAVSHSVTRSVRVRNDLVRQR